MSGRFRGVEGVRGLKGLGMCLLHKAHEAPNTHIQTQNLKP